MEQRTKARGPSTENEPAPEPARQARVEEEEEATVEEEEESTVDESDEEELEPELDALLCLAQMDSEAAAAYEAAAAAMTEENIAKILADFAADHRQHVTDIQRFVTELGGEPDLASPTPEMSTFALMAETLSEIGDSAGLRALIASEMFTNSAYDTALELISEPRARALLEKNFADERRHLETLQRLLAPSERAEERQ